MLREGLTYLEFTDACRGDFSGQVQKCLEYFAIIYQGFLAKNYIPETMHFIDYFKKLWKEEFMQAWLDYYLINPSGRLNKFYADDRFGKTIIKLCKEKVRPSSNASSDKFLQEIIAPNVLSLWKIKEVMAGAIQSTSHGNHHSPVGSTSDLSLLVKILVEDKVFEFETRRDTKNTEFVDLFAYRSSKIRLRGPLKGYQY